MLECFFFFLTGKKPSSNTAKKIAVVAVVGVAATAVGALAAPVIAGAALGAAGFTSAGVAAGSVAAGVQSAVYGGSVTAGSLFALCQSAGATGVIGSAATAFIGGGTRLAGIAGTLGSLKLFVRLDCLHNIISILTVVANSRTQLQQNLNDGSGYIGLLLRRTETYLPW